MQWQYWQYALASEDKTFLWGPYRPNLYFGIRPQVPESLLMGMMWGQGQNKESLLATLHDTCEQDDGLEGYGWTKYDTRFGGSQTIHDSPGHVDIDTAFVKTNDGDSWGVRINASIRPDAPESVKTAIIFHIAQEKTQNSTAKALECSSGSERKGGLPMVAYCNGADPALGKFQLQLEVLDDPGHGLVENIAVRSLVVPEEKIWQAKSVITDELSAAAETEGRYLVDGPGQGNMHFIQMVLEGPFTISITYASNAAAFMGLDEISERVGHIESTFSERVARVFPRTAPFQDDKYAEFTEVLLSNLLGGLGFFYGDSRVDYTNASAYLETDLDFWEKAAAAMARANITHTQPTSLLTHTPSRPAFPRGFLWDEGFHLLPVIEWDLDLAVSVLQSWLSLMDDDGWIGREQILGPEARSKVPEEFQVQYPHYANPPTLSLLFPVLISKLNNISLYTGNPSKYMTSQEEASSMVTDLYALLSRHYQWFRRTQAGNFSSSYARPEGAMPGEGYRWRGRTPMSSYTSGLDDYPRPEPPHPGELHVDALAWVGASAQALQQVAAYLGLAADAAMYGAHADAVRRNLDTLHWDASAAAYCDTTVADDDDFARVCHLGYVSLMPLALGLLADANATHLPAVLDLLADPARLWSAHGVRSLSAADPGYRADGDYWRGAVWMHLNVLLVLRLRDLAGAGADPERARAGALAARLRTRVVGTVFDAWAATGFVWEQYDDRTGEGRRSRAFTGWTACVVLLMGLDLGDAASSSSGAWLSTPRAALLVVFLALVLMYVLRDRVAGIAALATARWRSIKGLGGRDRGVYQEVVDLDDLGGRHGRTRRDS
ncbi:glycoside hydrolase family 63 protein [Xylariomycetidae sp. FL0641]|nr:glycoside hydrolase family 63 protein [Xylariomycetidae sp. FL0641]